MAELSSVLPLRSSNLHHFRGRLAVPAYNRDSVEVGIVHIGVGNFHRAHQAAYVDEILHRPQPGPWGICGVGLLPGDRRMRDALVPQNGLYTLIERGDEDTARVVGSIVRYLYAPEETEAVLDAMAASSTRIVSLTITEGGYPVDSETGVFDANHPDIHRKTAPTSPGTFAFLLEALRRRRERGLEPFTVMSCDNVRGNGDVARRSLLGLAERVDGDLRDWIDGRGAFPNSVVDRITPATTRDDRETVSARYGIADAWPVVTEPFRQWILEDRFPLGRPPWDDLGVQMTGDVRPYEMLKLRCLNGAHSAIAYPGALLGYEHIHEVAREDLFRRFLRRLWDQEIIPTLAPVRDIDPTSYTNTLVGRFSNPATRDRTSRVCKDGSSKLPTFILPTIRDRLHRGASIRLLSFVIASWCRYLEGRDERGRTIHIDDPLADILQSAARRGPAALLNVSEVFGKDLGREPTFAGDVEAAWKILVDHGARTAIAAYLRNAGCDGGE